jgi:hypothetical protein
MWTRLNHILEDDSEPLPEGFVGLQSKQSVMDRPFQA